MYRVSNLKLGTTSFIYFGISHKNIHRTLEQRYDLIGPELRPHKPKLLVKDSRVQLSIFTTIPFMITYYSVNHYDTSHRINVNIHENINGQKSNEVYPSVELCTCATCAFFKIISSSQQSHALGSQAKFVIYFYFLILFF